MVFRKSLTFEVMYSQSALEHWMVSSTPAVLDCRQLHSRQILPAVQDVTINRTMALSHIPSILPATKNWVETIKFKICQCARANNKWIRSIKYSQSLLEIGETKKHSASCLEVKSLRRCFNNSHQCQCYMLLPKMLYIIISVLEHN